MRDVAEWWIWLTNQGTRRANIVATCQQQGKNTLGPFLSLTKHLMSLWAWLQPTWSLLWSFWADRQAILRLFSQSLLWRSSQKIVIMDYPDHPAQHLVGGQQRSICNRLINSTPRTDTGNLYSTRCDFLWYNKTQRIIYQIYNINNILYNNILCNILLILFLCITICIAIFYLVYFVFNITNYH